LQATSRVGAGWQVFIHRPHCGPHPPARAAHGMAAGVR